MKKKIILIVLAVGLIGAAIAYKIMMAPAETVNTSKADFTTSAIKMYNEFAANEKTANLKYTNKIVQVTGVITEISKHTGGATITLATEDDINEVICGVNKTIAEKLQNKTNGETITLKGEFSAYDDDITLSRCDVVAQ